MWQHSRNLALNIYIAASLHAGLGTKIMFSVRPLPHSDFTSLIPLYDYHHTPALLAIRSHRDVALETEQAAEKKFGSQSPASEIRIAASSMMEHRQGHMILQGKTKSECLMNQPRISTDTKTHPVTPRFHLAFGL